MESLTAGPPLTESGVTHRLIATRSQPLMPRPSMPSELSIPPLRHRGQHGTDGGDNLKAQEIDRSFESPPSTVPTNGSPFPAAVIGVFVAGILLRLSAFLSNRSLWLDEAMLVRNIITRSFSQLTQPLLDSQGAPPGYLGAVKILVMVFGRNEYALRGISILSALASLVFFVLLSRRYFDGWPRVMSCGLFALCPALILYADEAKQYSSDVFISTALFYVALRYREASTSSNVTLLAVTGTLSIWFSHPAAFMLATIGFMVFAGALRERDSSAIRTSLTIGTAWICSFGLLYVVSLRQLTSNDVLLRYWSASFVPWSVGAITWLWNSYWLFVLEPFGGRLEPTGYLVAWLFAVGVIGLFSKDPTLAWMVGGPILFTLFAAVFHLYPFGGFGGRLSLFTVPALALGAAAGCQVVAENRPRAVAWVLGIALFLPLTKIGVREARGDVKSFRQPEEIRPLIQAMRRQARAGDHVYVYRDAEPAFSVYGDHLGYLSELNLQIKNGQVNKTLDAFDYERDLESLRDLGRVWIVYSHSNDHELSDEDALLSAARKYGDEVATFQGNGASVRLFDFNRPD
jgi:hypothetical protein